MPIPRRQVTALFIVMTVAAAGCGFGDEKPGRADKDAPKDFTTTPSGLKYRILRKSADTKPTSSSTVKVHYRGWLDDDSEIDNTYTAKKGPAEFRLNQTMPAWSEGLQLIGQGGMIELEIPPALGYGARGMRPRIPPNATLHYIFELKAVR
jgi:FKBP-type peptidyl-prolyl cis-trans isomerase